MKINQNDSFLLMNINFSENLKRQLFNMLVSDGRQALDSGTEYTAAFRFTRNV